jgi:Sec-independent protein secretion pathway component TatC
MLAGPLILLFEGSLILMRITEKRRVAEPGEPEPGQEESAAE